jgi:F-box/leucine-rich repeat protein 2/20
MVLPKTLQSLLLSNMTIGTDLLEAVAACCPNMTSFVLHLCHMEPNAMNYITSHFPTITRFAVMFSSGWPINDGSLQAIAKNWPQLEQIVMIQTCITNEGLHILAKSGIKLTRLGLVCCHSFTDAGLAAFISQHPNLDQVHIRYNYRVNSASISVLAINCSNLSELDLTETSIDDECLTALAAASPPLKKLTLAQCKKITNFGFGALVRQCPQLESVSVECCSQLGDEILHSLAAHHDSMNIDSPARQNLLDVNLSVCPKLTEQALSKLLLECPNLSSLAIARWKHLGTIGISAIASSCPNLHSLDLSFTDINDIDLIPLTNALLPLKCLNLNDCKSLSDASVKTLIANSPRLEQLKMSCGDEAIAKVVKHCPSLHSLTISCCLTLTDRGLSLLAHAGLPYDKVTFNNCHKITDEGLAFFFQRCNDLTYISLDDSTKVGDSTVQTIAKNCHFLRHLCLERTAVSDNGLLALAGSPLPLNTLKIGRCPNISNMGISALSEERVPYMRLVHNRNFWH